MHKSHSETWGMVVISQRIKPGLGALVQFVSNLRAYLTKEARHGGDSLPQGDNLHSTEPERKDLHHVQIPGAS